MEKIFDNETIINFLNNYSQEDFPNVIEKISLLGIFYLQSKVKKNFFEINEIDKYLNEIIINNNNVGENIENKENVEDNKLFEKNICEHFNNETNDENYKDKIKNNKILINENNNNEIKNLDKSDNNNIKEKDNYNNNNNLIKINYNKNQLEKTKDILNIKNNEINEFLSPIISKNNNNLFNNNFSTDTYQNYINSSFRSNNKLENLTNSPNYFPKDEFNYKMGNFISFNSFNVYDSLNYSNNCNKYSSYFPNRFKNLKRCNKNSYEYGAIRGSNIYL
jgi:hypothetical protein